MSFSAITGFENGTVATATTVTVAVTGVSVGDLIVAWVTGDSTTTVTQVTDGTTNFTLLTGNASGSHYGQFNYLLASVASGSLTYTATYSATTVDRDIIVYRATPTAAVTFDVENHAATGISANPASNNVTTTGTDEIVFGGSWIQSIGANYSAPLINAGAATGSTSPDHQAVWYKAFASTLTGNASITWTATAAWLASIVSFKIPGSGGGGGPGSQNPLHVYTYPKFGF